MTNIPNIYQFLKKKVFQNVARKLEVKDLTLINCCCNYFSFFNEFPISVSSFTAKNDSLNQNCEIRKGVQKSLVKSKWLVKVVHEPRSPLGEYMFNIP